MRCAIEHVSTSVEKEICHSTKEATITTISGAPSATAIHSVINAISVTTGTVSEIVANTEPKNRFIARWTWLFNTAFNAPKPSRRQNQQCHQEASKGDRGVSYIDKVSSELAFILVTAITAIRWMIDRITCHGCYGQTVYRDAGRHHHCQIVP